MLDYSKSYVNKILNDSESAQNHKAWTDSVSLRPYNSRRFSETTTSTPSAQAEGKRS